MASFSGNLLPLLLLVSLFSSSLVTGVPTRQYFSKSTRSATPENTQTEQKQEQKQPDFYPEDEKPHGLYDNTPANQAPPITPKPNVPTPSKQWLPSNYDPNYYVSKPDERSPYSKQIIEADTNAVPTAETLNESDLEEEEFDTTDFVEQNPAATGTPTYRQRTKTLDRADPTHKSQRGTTNKKGFGMSDTRDLESGKYHYDLNSERFTSLDHPYNAAVQTNKNHNYDRYSSQNGNYDRYASQTNKNGYRNYDRYSYNDQTEEP